MLDLLALVPGPGQKRIAVHLKPAAERAVAQGHPWVFDQSIRHQNRVGKTGDLAVIFDRKNNFLAIGLLDPTSPLRIRILHHDDPAPIDQEWFRLKIAAALARRIELATQDTNAYRLVHGENDGLPGLVVDRYASTQVVKLDTAAWLPHLAQVLAAMQQCEPAEQVILRLSRNARAQTPALFGLKDGQWLLGQPSPMPITFLENGLRFAADVVQGQKTGFFLDQRDNRSRVEKLILKRPELKRVLNLFAYSGGFGVYAARGGAREIVEVDASEPALETADLNYRLNRQIPQVAASHHQPICGDVFQVLEKLAGEQELFDLVIVDPPAFAKAQAEVDSALAAYRRLVVQALTVLRTDGVLVMASCSNRVSANEFFELIHDLAKRLGRPLREIDRTGQPIDHPIGFPEGAYLKCLFAEVG